MRIFRRALSIFACAMPLVLLCMCGGMLPMAAAIVLHECAHLIALRFCKGQMLSFHVAPFGLCIAYDENTLSLAGEMLVCAAGCLCNLLLAAVTLFLYCFSVCDWLQFGIVNALICGMNLLPILPLDGARLLRLCLSMRLSPDQAERVVRIVTHVCSFFVFLPASYLLLSGQTGIYFLLFSVYIFAANACHLSES